MVNLVLITIVTVLIAFYPRAKAIKDKFGVDWITAYYWAITTNIGL